MYEAECLTGINYEAKEFCSNYMYSELVPAHFQLNIQFPLPSIQLLSKVFLTLTAFSTTLSSASPLPGQSGHSGLTGISSDSFLRATHLRQIDPDTCKYPLKTFQQKVDHPNPGLSFAAQHVHDEDDSGLSETFSQRYQVINKYFKPGGPIFFLQDGESQYQCAEGFISLLYAMEAGAMVVGIEHRYFGSSVPGDLSLTTTTGWDASTMASLTLSNVLIDSVKLVQHIQSTVSGARDSKVIVFGGSYSGTLAALLRIHFPDIFFGAFATSGAFGGLVSDPHDPLVHAWSDWSSRVIEDASPVAAGKIRKAFQALRDDPHMLPVPRSAGFDLASPTDAKIVEHLFKYNNLIQYDQGGNASRPFTQLIKETLQKDDDDNSGILGVADQLSPRLPINSMMMTPYQYLVCTYLPYPLSFYPSANSVWGELSPDYSFTRINDAVCQQKFGINSTDAGYKYQRQLGLDQQSLEASSRIFFTIGTEDPITSLSTGVFWNSENKEGSRVYVITGGSHCEEMIAATTFDKASVNEARLAQLNTIKQWLGKDDDLPDHYPDIASKGNLAQSCNMGVELQMNQYKDKLTPEEFETASKNAMAEFCPLG